MASNRKTPITELDFSAIKDQLKTFLRNDPKSKFKDYDFEGSNFAVLLDVLAYNTYQNNFYTNMAISEMFLDSAQIENSVVSHVKELNYLPKSASASKAVLNIKINDPDETRSSITIPKYTKFSSQIGKKKYNFYTLESYIARKQSSGLFSVDNVEIFQGEFVEEGFFVSPERKTIRLLNENIDTSTITVISNKNLPDAEVYSFKKDIYGVGETDLVFYLEAAFDKTYEIVFGENLFGKTPELNEKVTVSYLVTRGAEANGCKSFSTSLRPDTLTCSVVSPASDGSDRENISETKFFAPKSIQIQERAVTFKDYEILLKQNFNEILDISVYGGDELNPPQYGKVALSVNVDGGLSEISSNTYKSFILDKMPVGIQPIFIEPKYIYVSGEIVVQYDSRNLNRNLSDLSSDLISELETYVNKNLNKFESVFRISRITSILDQVDDSILSTNITLLPYQKLNPDLNLFNTFSLDYGSSIIKPYKYSSVSGFDNFKSSVSSSTFTYNGTKCVIQDDGDGNLLIVNSDLSKKQILNKSIGVIDYENGSVKLSDFKISSFDGTTLDIYAETEERNITATKDKILRCDTDDLKITFIDQNRK